jgi:glycosyltransferase involved in cell wall biosynthesis
MTDPANPASAAVDITIVITCYNEEAFITDTIGHVTAALETTPLSFEIIVVDDLSQDGSVRKVRDYIKSHPAHRVQLVENKANRGLANNYIEAAFLGRGRYYRLCCGDDSEDPEALVNIFRHVGVADIVIPFQNQDEVGGKTLARRQLSKLFTFLVNLISGHRIKYYNGMAVHLRHNVLRWHPSSYGFGFQADILTRLLDEGASYVQVRAFGTDRKGGDSTALTTRNVLSVCHTLLELAVRRVRREIYYHSAPKPVEYPALAETGKKNLPGAGA